LLISVSMVSGVSSIIGGTFSPLKMVSGAFSSQSSFLAVDFALGVSAANVEASVASDSRVYKTERITAQVAGGGRRGNLSLSLSGCG